MLRHAVAALLLAATPAVAAPSCPAPLDDATRLLVVLTDGFGATAATARLYSRDAPGGEWRPDGPKKSAVVGAGGVGWAFDQTERAEKGEPVKREGDGRTPAGIFRAGHAFGNDARKLSDYMTLGEGTSCVDDIASPLYNTIVPEAKLGKSISHEKMWQIPLYRQGLLVEHATGRAQRGGSCIFLHVQRGPGRPTVGCVATDEASVERIQEAFDARPAAIAILPRKTLARYDGCGLPQ